MSQLIPEAIQHDMATFLKLFQHEQNFVVDEQGLTSELCDSGGFEFGGLKLAFDSSNSPSYTAEEPYEDGLFFSLVDRVHIYTKHLYDNTYSLLSSVRIEGLDYAEFPCTYDFDTAKGLPPSIYQAYAYLCSGLKLHLERRLEIFSAMTSSLPLNNWDIFDEYDGTKGAMGYYFDVISAFEHDMFTQQLTTA